MSILKDAIIQTMCEVLEGEIMKMRINEESNTSIINTTSKDIEEAEQRQVRYLAMKEIYHLLEKELEKRGYICVVSTECLQRTIYKKEQKEMWGLCYKGFPQAVAYGGNTLPFVLSVRNKELINEFREVIRKVEIETKQKYSYLPVMKFEFKERNT